MQCDPNAKRGIKTTLFVIKANINFPVGDTEKRILNLKLTHPFYLPSCKYTIVE